ncbi:MAG: hypothetical protein IJE07_02385 [Clostridia bacterium]|nr:hypothetical protein [Clostridia bacterium]
MSRANDLLRIDRDPALRRSSYVGMFDLPKGLLMLAIIAFHSVNDYSMFTSWAYRQPLPLRTLLSLLSLLHYGLTPALFMTCGFGERREKLVNNVRRHISPLIIPYICVTIAVMILVPLRQLLSGESVMQGLKEQGLAFLLGLHLRLDGVGNIGPLWFPTAYAAAGLMLNLLLRVKKEWLRWLLLVAGAALAIVTSRLPIPFCIQQALVCTGLLYAGYLLRQHKVLTRPLPVWLCGLIWLVCIIAMTFRGYVEFSLAYFRRGLPDLVVAYAAGYALLRLLMQLNALQGRLPDAIRWIGRHMFWLCCIHTVVRLGLPWDAFIALFGANPIPGYLIELVLQLALALSGCWLLDHLVFIHHYKANERKPAQ